ncbi:GNAT family N-acetyltransferase, partial [Oceanibaculum nanhaiense]
MDEAELAITVESEFEGRGIGTQLMRRVVTLARNRG